jgi:hypothetical protein
MQKPEIIENALTPIEFEAIRAIIDSFNFPWHWFPRLNSYQKLKNEKLNHSYLYHNFNIYNNNVAAPYDQIFIPLLKFLKVKVLIRMHANMYMHTSKIEEHTDHKDQGFPCQAAILYLNTCNGSTVIKKEHRVMSVANRLVKFRGDWLHHSTSSTNQKRRLVLNINYI